MAFIQRGVTRLSTLMKWVVFLTCFYQNFPCQAQLLTASTRRILFLGNSITWDGRYVTAIDAFLATHYPDRQIEVINAGLSSETVSGLSEPGHAGGSFPRPALQERLQRVLDQVKPDLVFACYGMNDGIYLPFDSSRFRLFKEGISLMHDEVTRRGATIVHLTPPDYDEERGNSAGYTKVLDRYADWLLGMRDRAGWKVVDIHYPMKEYLQAHRELDRKYKLRGFALSDDGVHPGATGHWIIARQVLQYLGFKEVSKSASITESLLALTDPQQFVQVVGERQRVTRDAWLSTTKHKRPGLPEGLPLAEAQIMSANLGRQLKAMLHDKKLAEVYLLAGQSNATGQGYLANMADSMKINRSVILFHSGKPHLDSGLPPYTWQPMHQASESPDRFGPELGFSSAIRPVVAGATIALIKHAHSGSNLYEEWNPGFSDSDTIQWGVHFAELVHTVNAAMDSLRSRGYEPIIRGMLWQQGEAEAYSADSISVRYGIMLKHFIARLRSQFQAPSMVFVYGYVCPPPLTGTGMRTIRQAQHDVDQGSGMGLSVRKATVVPTDDLSHRANDKGTRYPQDHLHFGTDGTWLLGQRMAYRMMDVLQEE